MTEHVLVVDLDETLLSDDSLYIAVLTVLRRKPRIIIWALFMTIIGRRWAGIKEEIFSAAALKPETLLYNEYVLKYISSQHEKGSKVVLATASPKKFAESVASYLGYFSEIHGSDGETNLKGKIKAEFLTQLLGAGCFDYIGDSKADVPVWKVARNGFAVAELKLVSIYSQQSGKTLTPIPSAASKHWALALVQAVRPHQWTKNLLVFVPLLAAHLWRKPVLVINVGFFCICFCLAASSVYIINDLLDLSSDRAHPSKKKRPIASGRLSIRTAFLFGILFTFAAVFAAQLAGRWGLLVVAYLAVANVYSFKLKQVPVLDLFALCALYIFRIWAGARIVNVPVSLWLLTFSAFSFMSLACMKRYSELARSSDTAKLSRNYSTADMPFLSTIGLCCAVAAVLVLGMYVNSEVVTSLYLHVERLWLLLPLVLFWFMFFWRAAFDGAVDFDPVAMATKHPMSVFLVFACCSILVLAT